MKDCQELDGVCVMFRQEWPKWLWKQRIVLNPLIVLQKLGMASICKFDLASYESPYFCLNQHRRTCPDCFGWEQENCSTVPMVFVGSKMEPAGEFSSDKFFCEEYDQSEQEQSVVLAATKE